MNLEKAKLEAEGALAKSLKAAQSRRQRQEQTLQRTIDRRRRKIRAEYEAALHEAHAAFRDHEDAHFANAA